MKPVVPKPQLCAIYTRKSTEHNLDLVFNSLDAQREACEAYIKSQEHEGWRLVPDRYNDGGLSGASLDRPALQQLLADVRAGKVTIVVVYKVDRLTRSLADFAKLVELFDEFRVSFVSITQSFEESYDSPGAPVSNFPLAAHLRRPCGLAILRHGVDAVRAMAASPMRSSSPHAIAKSVSRYNSSRRIRVS